MSLIRLKAAEVLGAIFQRHIPDVDICGGPAEDGHRRRLPSIAIRPINFKMSSDQETEHKDIGNRLILNVGRYDAFFRIEVGAKSPYVRAKLEQAIIDIMFSQEERGGTLVVYIAECHDAIVSYELGDSRWQDEAGFSDKWFSELDLNVVMPILVERGTVPIWNEIRLCVRADVAHKFDDISTAIQECIAVDENGTVTITTPPPS